MDGLVTSSGQELGILKNRVWFFLLEGGPGGRECKPPRGLGVYGCGLVIADGVGKAGRDDRLTVRDAPHHLLVTGEQNLNCLGPDHGRRRRLEGIWSRSCSQKEAMDGVGIRE